MNHAFDAGPMIAFLDGEPGAPVTRQLLRDNPARLLCPRFQSDGSVLRLLSARGIERRRKTALSNLLNAGIIPDETADTAFWKDAATIKGSHALSLPDAFCLALARRLGGTAVTTDHNEFDPLVPLNLCPILFIR